MQVRRHKAYAPIEFTISLKFEPIKMLFEVGFICMLVASNLACTGQDFNVALFYDQDFKQSKL